MANNLCIHMATKECPRKKGIFCTSYVCALDEGNVSKDGEIPQFLKDLFGSGNPFGFKPTDFSTIQDRER